MTPSEEERVLGEELEPSLAQELNLQRRKGSFPAGEAMVERC